MSRDSTLEINTNLMVALGNSANQYAALQAYLVGNNINNRELHYLYTIAIRESKKTLFHAIHDKLHLNDKQKDEYLYEAIVKNNFDVAKILIHDGAKVNYVQNKNSKRTTLNALSNKIIMNQEMMDLFFISYNWNDEQITSALDEAIKHYAHDNANFLLSKISESYKTTYEFKKHILRHMIEVSSFNNQNKENYSLTFTLDYIKKHIDSEELATLGLTLCNELTPLNIYQALIENGAKVNHYQTIKVSQMLTNKTEEQNTHMLYHKLMLLPKTWNDGKLFSYLKSVGLNQDHQGVLNMLFQAHFDLENPFVKWLFNNEPQVLSNIIKTQMKENKYFAVQYGKKLNSLLEKIEVIDEKFKLESLVESSTMVSEVAKKGMKI